MFPHELFRRKSLDILVGETAEPHISSGAFWGRCNSRCWAWRDRRRGHFFEYRTAAAGDGVRLGAGPLW